MISTKQIIKKIGCDKLSLYKGEGYWYFSYDDPDNNLYETYSVYVMYLKELNIERWIEEGKSFVKSVENKDETI